ncbi:MAG: hypothetical protein Q8882_03920 [Bacillota bacterium]|nr:hypothetical protein [Bacillota bacterium]
MDEKILSATECERCTENVCISASQIYDTCRAKECLENLRVFFCAEGQNIIESASSVKVTNAEVIWVYSDVESLPFNRGYYTVDLKFFFRVEFNAFTGLRRPVPVDGLACFEKKVVLFGSEGVAKIFQSKYKEDSFDVATWKKTNMPNAVVEVVDPIALNSFITYPGDPAVSEPLFDISSVPDCVHRVFDNTLVDIPGQRQVYVTLGLFLMVRLERDVQITVPAASFCIPESDCKSSEDPCDPCDLFDKLCFPVDEFFPPKKCDFKDYEPSLNNAPYEGC